MATPRSQQIDLEVSTDLHCVSRCVRRSFLCGDDQYSGKNFDHRKDWLVRRLKFQGEIFSMQICAYSILDNHYHLVLRVAVDAAAEWSDEEVIARAGRLCPGRVEGIENWSDEVRQAFVATWRARLIDVSWFMARLNEYIGRRANKEDGVTGRFWEARFRSQALLNEGALLACMTYVDLNPVRAGLAQGLDDSDWTSIRQRIIESLEASQETKGSDSVTGQEEPEAAVQEQKPETETDESVPAEPIAEQGNDDAPSATGGDSPQSAPACDQLKAPTGVPDAQEEEATPSSARDKTRSAPALDSLPTLAPFNGGAGGLGDPLSMDLEQYMGLLEATGRRIREGKRGRITGAPSKLIAKLGLDPDTWLDSVQQFESFGVYIGRPDQLDERASNLGKRRVRGRNQMKGLYRKAA